MKLGLNLPYEGTLAFPEAVELAQRAEALGFESVWMPEAYGIDAVSILGALAARTQRIQLGTGIVNVFSRTPALLAQTAATLDLISGGRFILGLGTSGHQVITGWHGMAFDRPLLRMRETIAIIRQVLRRDRLIFEGEVFRLDKGLKLLAHPVRETPVMWTTGDHHPSAAHDVPGDFQPSWISPDEVAAAVEKNGGDRPLFGGTILDDTLWACTMCGACMDQCPVLIEHVPKILDMRRHLVLDESRLPRQAESALRNIENVANPYGLSHQSRADWAKDLGVQFAADKPGAEYLYWVGCAASFDDRAKTIATALVKILQAGGVDFAILGTEEKCTGDPARRIGNEYLFQERAKENVEVLKKHDVRKIIASCPHCFNTFSNEYPDFGGTYEVFHHTQIIEKLMKEGRLKLDETKAQQETITYHDSCYLGRWNDVFAPPRDILERIPGLRVVEMARNRSEGMCCGAGGGRMWMEEDQPRVNHRRVDQAVETEATKVATACPFCLAMFDEGIASRQLGDRIAVDDVAVYVARSLADSSNLDAPSVSSTSDQL